MSKLHKAVSLLALVVLPAVGAGCLAPPAYTPLERYQMIGRNMDYEGRQAVDDLDHILLTRPASRLTIWNVR